MKLAKRYKKQLDNAVLAFHVKEQSLKCEVLCKPDKVKGL